MSLNSVDGTALQTAHVVGQVVGQDHLLSTITQVKAYLNQLEEDDG